MDEQELVERMRAVAADDSIGEELKSILFDAQATIMTLSSEYVRTRDALEKESAEKAEYKEARDALTIALKKEQAKPKASTVMGCTIGFLSTFKTYLDAGEHFSKKAAFQLGTDFDGLKDKLEAVGIALLWHEKGSAVLDGEPAKPTNFEETGDETLKGKVYRTTKLGYVIEDEGVSSFEEYTLYKYDPELQKAAEIPPAEAPTPAAEQAKPAARPSPAEELPMSGPCEWTMDTANREGKIRFAFRIFLEWDEDANRRDDLLRGPQSYPIGQVSRGKLTGFVTEQTAMNVADKKGAARLCLERADNAKDIITLKDALAVESGSSVLSWIEYNKGVMTFVFKVGDAPEERIDLSDLIK